jgi:hypothetical protein
MSEVLTFLALYYVYPNSIVICRYLCCRVLSRPILHPTSPTLGVVPSFETNPTLSTIHSSKSVPSLIFGLILLLYCRKQYTVYYTLFSL